MKRYGFILLALVFLCPKSPAAQLEMKGFIALDLMVLKKIERRNQELLTGIGVLDLRVYAQEGPMAGKIKLDLDDSNIGEPFNIFEEVQAYYRFTDDLRVTAGKSKVPFHRMHWGVIENIYADGGSIIGTNHSWWDVDNKVLLGILYGSYQKGYEYQATYWGDSETAVLDRTGQPELDANSKLQFRNTKTFSTKQQRGFANKLEFFPNNNFSTSLGAIYYRSDYDPHARYAFDHGWRWFKSGNEVWFEYVYGAYSTHPGAPYAVYKVAEHMLQLGFEKYLTEKFNFLANTEAAIVNQTRHLSSIPGNDGLKRDYNTYKFETGIKWKTTENSFVTFGGLWEQQFLKISGAKQPDTYAYEIATKLSYWF